MSDGEEVVIEEGDVGEMPAELLASVVEEATEEEMLEAAEKVAEVDDMDVVDELLAGEESADAEARAEGESPQESEEEAPEEEVEPEEEEVESEEAAPNEPDPPAEEEDSTPDPPEDLGPQDPMGIVTNLSPVAFAKLQEIWKSRGNPHQFDYQGSRWSAYDNGEKFVRTGGQGSMDQFYGSLSIG